jgi:hypothetical protein
MSNGCIRSGRRILDRIDIRERAGRKKRHSNPGVLSHDGYMDREHSMDQKGEEIVAEVATYRCEDLVGTTAIISFFQK